MTLLLRDQVRARHAYEVVATVRPEDRKDYKIAINDLGANILRNGLCAALATVQRLGDRGKPLLGHLAAASVVGLEDASDANLAKRVRELDGEAYVMATREMLQVTTWLKRAVQATFKDD